MWQKLGLWPIVANIFISLLWMRIPRGRDTERSHELPEPLNKAELKARTLSRAPTSLFRVFSTIGSVSFHWCVCIFLCWRGHRCSPAFFFFITLSKTYFLFVISLFHPGHLITFLWAVSAIFWRKKKRFSKKYPPQGPCVEKECISLANRVSVERLSLLIILGESIAWLRNMTFFLATSFHLIKNDHFPICFY